MKKNFKKIGIIASLLAVLMMFSSCSLFILFRGLEKALTSDIKNATGSNITLTIDNYYGSQSEDDTLYPKTITIKKNKTEKYAISNGHYKLTIGTTAVLPVDDTVDSYDDEYYYIDCAQIVTIKGSAGNYTYTVSPRD